HLTDPFLVIFYFSVRNFPPSLTNVRSKAFTEVYNETYPIHAGVCCPMIDQKAQTLALTEIQRLRTSIAEVMTALQSQQELLRMRGMNLPPGAMQNLENIDLDLKSLERRLNNE